VQFINLDMSALWPIRRLRRLGIGTVFTHTLLGDFSPKFWKRALQRVHRRLPLNLVDRVVVSSSVMKSDLEALGTSTAIDVIPNGVDTKRFQPAASAEEKEALRRKLGLPSGVPLVLSIGPIIPRKGTDALVDAFGRIAQRNPRAVLVLVGPRHDLERPALAPFRQRIETLLREHGLAERVLFPGAVSAVEEYLRACDVFVFTSKREGMPNVVCEAMASGIPVVSTPFIGLPAEFGAPGKQYILSQWTPEVLAADLDGLLQNASRRRELSEQGRRWAVERLDVEQSLQSYAALYREIRRLRRR
jgi:glycosyltransferase involved in cell wall biosynthesis